MAAARPAAGPSSSKNDHIDLYSDIYPNDEDSEANDLFDAVLTGSVGHDKTTPKEDSVKKEDKPTDEKTQKDGMSQRRFCLYIGNFPWWTSDEELLTMARKLSVRDIAEIKFAENKANGQSRGFAEVVVSSEESLKILLEKIPQCHINGEHLHCRFATHQNLSVFEDVANKRMPLRVNSDSKVSDSTEKTSTSIPSQESKQPPVPPPFLPHSFANSFPPRPNPFLAQPPPLFPPHMPPVMPPLMPPHMFPPNPVQTPVQPPPSFHMSPPFFSGTPDVRSIQPHSQQTKTSQNTDGDFEELMNRNRTIASSAITKAVSGATAGDLRMAMETLLTAIAIIKQSRVYGDGRCQALVTSLKDCLVSIQGDCDSSSRSKGKDRDRDRGRDRDVRDRDVRDRERYRERERDGSYNNRESAGTSRRHRDRSWSGDGDKERSREREKHRDYRDRYY